MSMSKKLPQFAGGTLFLLTDLIVKLLFLFPDGFNLSETQCETLSGMEKNMPYVAAGYYVLSFMLLCFQHYYWTGDTCCRNSKNAVVAPQVETKLIESPREGLIRRSSKQQLVINQYAWLIQLASTEIILLSYDQILKTFIPSMVSGIILGLYILYFLRENVFHDERCSARCKKNTLVDG